MFLLNTVVLSILAAFVSSWLYKKRQRSLELQRLSAKYGCEPIRHRIMEKWPLGIDLLKSQYDALQRKQLLDYQQPFVDKHAPTFEIRILGTRGYSTIDPANIEAMYARIEDWGMGHRREGIFPLVGEGIFCQDGEAWKHSRAILRKQFARLEYHDLTTFKDYVEGLIQRLKGAGGVVDLQPAFFDFTLSTTLALLFGEAFDNLGKDRRAEFSRHFDHAATICAMRLRLAEHSWLYTPSSFLKSCKAVKDFAGHFVDRALSFRATRGRDEAFEQYPFITDLYDNVQDPGLVRDQLVNVLLAGRDTTACSLSWVFFLLVRHPDVMDCLRHEIQKVTLGDTNITKQHIRQMPYLKAVWDETLRLYPQIPINVRIANKHTCLPRGGGPLGDAPILMPKGTGVGVSVYHMHRTKALFGEDADAFRPERWQTGELDGIGYGYIPFHNGPRICLGKDFATLEASYAIIRVLQTFPDLCLPPNEVPVPCGKEPQNLGIVVSSAEGCKVILK